MYVCMYSQHEYDCFGHGVGPGGILLWPAILLSTAGYSRTWVTILGAALGLCLLSAWCVRKRPLWITPILAVAVSITYSSTGVFVFRHLSAPVPTVTPYDSDAAHKREYVATFVEGYKAGISGIMRTYCFAPEHTTRGYYEGQAKGNRIYSRSLGMRDASALNAISAARDGVSLDSTEDVEPEAGPYGSPAAGSPSGQP